MTERRPNATQRGYDSAWRKRRADHLACHPYCERCGEPANTVDHRKARRRFPLHLQGSDQPGGSEHPSNYRSLCRWCHSRRADDKARR